MSKPPKIADELMNLPHMNVNDLEPFQGDLKELTKREYSKLKKSLNENGVIVPFFVWLEENKLLDGHQRQRVFVSENWLIDVPVVYISADSEQDAKKKLLVISSQYGKVTQEGWDGFTFDLDDSWIKDTVQFDALPFVFNSLAPTDPANDAWAEWEGMPEFEQNAISDNKITVYFMTNDARFKFSELVKQDVNEKTKFIWFPKESKPMRQNVDLLIVENE